MVEGFEDVCSFKERNCVQGNWGDVCLFIRVDRPMGMLAHLRRGRIFVKRDCSPILAMMKIGVGSTRFEIPLCVGVGAQVVFRVFG